MIVSKFGGSSLADAQQIKKACEIVLSDSNRKIMVVSAPGKRSPSDFKITDMLISLANDRISGMSGNKMMDNILQRFSDIAEALLIEEIIPSLKEYISLIANADIVNKDRYIDSVKSLGEDFSARIVATYLNSIGIKAVYCNPKVVGLYLGLNFGRATVLPESYENLANLKELDGICVFPGFYGYSKDGEIITFSRGGSDITGSILSAAVGAEVYENWTDVDCVYAVNPSLVDQPFPINEITYDEMRELAYAGFSVLHEEALYPAFRKGIPVHIRNTNNPSCNGTKIVAKRAVYDSLVTGIAGEKGFCTLNLKKYLMNREIGFIVKVLQIIADEGLSVEHIPSGIDSISVIMRSPDFTADKERRVVERISLELQIDEISVDRNLAIVMIVGEAMAHTVGTTARAALALSKAGINLEIINQGSSEISVMFGIKEEYCSYAVRELYKEFFV